MTKIHAFFERRTRYGWSAAVSCASIVALGLMLASLPNVNLVFVLAVSLTLGATVGLMVDWRLWRRRRDLSQQWRWADGVRTTDYQGITLMVTLGKDGRYRCQMAVGGRITTWPVGSADTEQAAKSYLVALAAAMVHESKTAGVDL